MARFDWGKGRFSEYEGPFDASKLAAAEQARNRQVAAGQQYRAKPTSPNDEDRFAPINTEGIFGGASSAIDRLAEQSKREAQIGIQRRAEAGEAQATAALAGAGLGRSGFAADVFSGIQQEGISAVERVQGQIEGERLRLQADLKRREAEARYADDLRIAQWKEEDIRGATEFDRMLYKMQFANDLQKDLLEFNRELNEEGGWGQMFADFVDFGLSGFDLYFDITTGNAAISALNRIAGG